MALDQIKVELQERMGTDRTIAEAAWTSTTDEIRKAAKQYKDVKRVVEFLIEHGHTSPLEQVVFRFHYRIPIFTSRQFLRYRMMSPNEMSGRYRTMPNDYYTVPQDISDIVGKFADPLEYVAEYDAMMTAEYAFYDFWLKRAKEAEKVGVISNDEYKRFREVQRGPLGTAFFTEIVCTMNLHCLQHILTQRLAKEAQKEIQTMAYKMLKEVIIENNVPIALKAMAEKKGWLDKYELALVDSAPDALTAEAERLKMYEDAGGD
jgi:thymidylate synthase (FAD)